MPNSSSLSITNISKEENIILFRVNGCNVSAVCTAQPNHTVYEQVKSILISAILNKSTENLAKLDK